MWRRHAKGAHTRKKAEDDTRIARFTIVLTLALTAHAQSFDPLYKPKPGDEAISGRWSWRP